MFVKDLRVDRDLVYYENRLIIPIDFRQAVIYCIHTGHNRRNAMFGAVNEVWWPLINQQIVVVAKTCANCQKAGKNENSVERQKGNEIIRNSKQVNKGIALDFMGPFSGAPENRKILLEAVDHFPAYPTLKLVKSTDMEGVEKIFAKIYKR